MEFPLPPGLSRADLDEESTMLFDYGDCLALYSVPYRMGGVYRQDPGIWQLWFPIGVAAFSSLVSQFLEAHGLLERAGQSTVSVAPSLTIN